MFDVRFPMFMMMTMMMMMTILTIMMMTMFDVRCSVVFDVRCSMLGAVRCSMIIREQHCPWIVVDCSIRQSPSSSPQSSHSSHPLGVIF